jgi:hypothetical protein
MPFSQKQTPGKYPLSLQETDSTLLRHLMLRIWQTLVSLCPADKLGLMTEGEQTGTNHQQEVMCMDNFFVYTSKF